MFWHLLGHLVGELCTRLCHVAVTYIEGLRMYFVWYSSILRKHEAVFFVRQMTYVFDLAHSFAGRKLVGTELRACFSLEIRRNKTYEDHLRWFSEKCVDRKSVV